MKRFLSLALAVIMTFAIFGSVPFTESSFAIFASAADESVLTFTLSDDGTYYSVTGCDTTAEGEITIPAEHEGLPVTSIGDGAFQECWYITSVTIPQSIGNIGSYVFDNALNLESISVDENNTEYVSLDGVLFTKNKTVLIRYPQGKTETTYMIPNSVTSIDTNAFYFCEELISIIMPEGIEYVGDSAFSCCEKLTTITIPETVKDINNSAFYDCISLEAINVAENNMTYSSIDGVLFTKDKTTLIKCPENTKESNYIIPDATKTIENYAFYNCCNLTSVTIPEGLTNIGNYAFLRCASLLSVSIPDSVTNIGNNAFGCCTNLKSVRISNSIKRLADSIFSSCENLTTVTIPNSVTDIACDAFRDCYRLKTITIPDSVLNIGPYAFHNCKNLTTVSISNNITTLSDSLFKYCTNLTSVVIPDGVTSIGYSAFEGCQNLTSIKIPDNVNTIYASAFSDCTSLSDIVIGNSVQTIGSWAFYNCANIVNIDIPDSVTTIDDSVFSGCTKLSTLKIGSGVETIGVEAFYDCRGLENVYIDNIADWCNITFIDMSSNPLYYAKNFYLGDVLVTDIKIPDGVANIGAYTFYKYEKVTSIAIPHSVTNIDFFAFDDCTNLKYVFYAGSEEEWSTITIDEYNTYLTNAFIHYNSADHTYSADWTTDTEPTCTENGSKSRHCTVCGDKTDITPVDPLGHSYSEEWTIDKETSCGEEGLKSRHCTVCSDKTDITAIEKLPHTYSTEWTIDKETSCAEEGSKSRHCTVCGDKTDITAIEVLPHTPSEKWVHAPGFNCESGEMNYMHRLCTVCKQVVEAIEVAPGHSYVDGICEKCGNCDFSYTVSDGKVTITGYTGPKGEVTIPTTLGGYPVESIKAEAFSGNSNIVSIVIPDNIVTGDVVLKDMPNLTTVTLGNNITLSADAFSGCPAFEKLIFSDTVTAIPDNYLANNTVIKEIVLGSNVETIGVSAFESCTALENINLSNVSEIGSKAFYSCTSLYAVQLGDKIDTINESVFEGCSSLSELTLGANIKTIEGFAFAQTLNLQVVHLPDGLKTIGERAFFFSGVQTVIIPDSVETIGECAFASLNIKYAQLGKGIKSVQPLAFFGLLSAVYVIPKEVSGLEQGAFCLSGVSTIYYDGTEEEFNQLKESGVFREDTDFFGLKEIIYINDIPASSGYTDEYCYFEYPAGEIQLVDYLGFDSNVTVPSSVNDKSVTDINFAFHPIMDISIILSVDQNKPEKNFAFMFSPTEVTIPETVTSIDDFSFTFARQLEKINLPETIVSIGYGAFCYTALKSINLPANLERIGEDAFGVTELYYDTSNWENNYFYLDNYLVDISSPDPESEPEYDIVVRDGTYLIAEGVASGYSGIRNIFLPESIEIIGEGAFSDILNIDSVEGEEPVRNIFFLGTEEQWKNITIHSDNDIFTILPIHFEATDHVIASEWETAITPGCTHCGTQVKKCLYCTYKITEEIPATGHTLDENGVCKYCTSEVVEAFHDNYDLYDETITLHKETAGSVSLVFSNSTYVEPNSGVIYIYDGNDALIGEYVGTDLSGQTIVIQGNTVKIRLVSNAYGNYYYADVLWACAHTPAELSNVKDVTCTEDGYTGDVYCQNCSYTFSEGEIIKTTGHVMVNGFCQNCDHSLFRYSITDGQVTITGYYGENTVVEIPSTIGGYPVTALGEVFSETPVAQVIIPSGVSSIDVYCFLGAYNLTSITVAEDNPNYASEDGVLFNKEKTALITYPANKADEVYEIPEGVVEIEPYAFGYTKNLKEVVFPESTTTINEFAFCMSSLENFNYTDSIKTVGNYAFAYTDAVKFIEINENTEFIGECAFLNFGVICVLPASVENLAQASIYGISDMTVYYDGTEEQMAQLIADEKIVCDGNLTIIYGESVTSNTYGVFRYIETTDGEISIYDYNGNDKVVEIPSEINGKKVVDIRNTFTNLQYDFETGEIVSSPIEKIIVPDTVCKLSSCAFSGNGRLYEVILPDNITHIGSDIFNETAVYYTELNWYEGGLYVGNYLVDFSDSYSTIKIKDGTKLVADDVIGHNTKEIYIPASVEYIGENIFSSSTNLTSIFYGGNQEQWEKIQISENNDAINNAVIHYNATGHTNGNWIVDTLPTTTTTGSRHKECSVCGNITQEETLPATTGFEYGLNNETYTLLSFYNTQSEVIIPEEFNGKPVTAIGSGCFKDDMFVESVVIPETVTEIGSLAFMNCENLETVRIPESVTSIGKRAFYGFSGKIICYYGSFAHQYARDNGIDHFAITIEAIDSLTSVDYENKLIFTTMEATQQLSELIKTASVLNAESSVEVSYYGTGNIIQVKENGTIIEEYTLVVDGDLNGDSVCDVLDAFFAGRVVNEHATATTAQVYAANGELSEEIDIITYQRLVNKAVS